MHHLPEDDSAQQCANCLTSLVISATQTINRYYSLLHFLILVGILVAFSVVGGYVFKQIESPPEKRIIEAILRQRGSTIKQLRQKIANYETKLEITLFVQLYEGHYIGAIRNGTVIDKGVADPLWTFGGSVYYCVTTFTLLGYGNLAPKSDLGRVIAIIYSGFCIPIGSLIIGNIGEIILHMVEFVWSRISRSFQGKFKKKGKGRNMNHNSNSRKRYIIVTCKRENLERVCITDPSNTESQQVFGKTDSNLTESHQEFSTTDPSNTERHQEFSTTDPSKSENYLEVCTNDPNNTESHQDACATDPIAKVYRYAHTRSPSWHCTEKKIFLAYINSNCHVSLTVKYEHPPMTIFNQTEYIHPPMTTFNQSLVEVRQRNVEKHQSEIIRTDTLFLKAKCDSLNYLLVCWHSHVQLSYLIKSHAHLSYLRYSHIHLSHLRLNLSIVIYAGQYQNQMKKEKNDKRICNNTDTVHNKNYENALNMTYLLSYINTDEEKLCSNNSYADVHDHFNSRLDEMKNFAELSSKYNCLDIIASYYFNGDLNIGFPNVDACRHKCIYDTIRQSNSDDNNGIFNNEKTDYQVTDKKWHNNLDNCRCHQIPLLSHDTVPVDLSTKEFLQQKWISNYSTSSKQLKSNYTANDSVSATQQLKSFQPIQQLRTQRSIKKKRSLMNRRLKYFLLATPWKWLFVGRAILQVIRARKWHRTGKNRRPSRDAPDKNNNSDIWADPSIVSYSPMTLDQLVPMEEPEIEQSDVPILMTIIMTFLFIGAGSVMLTTLSVHLSFFDSFWFIFISMVTVGYGDVVPSDQQLFVFLLGYIFIGLSLMSNVINENGQFFNTNILKSKSIGHDAIAIITARRDILFKKQKSNLARSHWKLVRDRVRKGRIPPYLIEESRLYKARMLTEEREFVRWAFRIYFQKVEAPPEPVETDTQVPIPTEVLGFQPIRVIPSKPTVIQTDLPTDDGPDVEEKLTRWIRFKRFVGKVYRKTKTWIGEKGSKLMSKLSKKKVEVEEVKEKEDTAENPFYFA